MGIVSHSVDKMEEWSSKMVDNTSNYDELIENLYKLVHLFVGSDTFNGGLSVDFEQYMDSLVPLFKRYSETFRDSIEFINERIGSIEEKESELANRFNSNNYLG